jgi:hypothetical protein
LRRWVFKVDGQAQPVGSLESEEKCTKRGKWNGNAVIHASSVSENRNLFGEEDLIALSGDISKNRSVRYHTITAGRFASINLIKGYALLFR